jgi:hypothetical protein
VGEVVGSPTVPARLWGALKDGVHYGEQSWSGSQLRGPGRFIPGWFDDLAAVAAKGWTEPFQFLFVDGWHGYEAVLADGREWVPNLTDGGVVVFDDAHLDEVRQAIADLDREGTIHLWGQAFGQAYAGRRPNPPTSVRIVLACDQPLTRHPPGHSPGPGRFSRWRLAASPRTRRPPRARRH